MSYYTEIFDLPEEDIETLVVVHRGYAEVLKSRDDAAELYPWIASNLLYAASLQLLKEPALAKPIFREAAIYYRMLGMPFWKVCAICADDRELIFSSDQKEPTAGAYAMTEEDIFYDVLIDFDRWNFNSEFSTKTFTPRGYSAPQGRMGKLGIPFEFIQNLMEESHDWNGRQDFNGLENLSALLQRIYEFVEINKADEFHWKNMQSSILPLEPLGLAIIIVFVKRWLREGSFKALTSTGRFDSSQILLLSIANDLISGTGESHGSNYLN
jgi:hypothetical protein